MRSVGEVGQALEEGNALRATASHNLNEASSRSHALFTLHMELRKLPGAAQGHKYLRCKLHLVDLAGAALLLLLWVRPQALNRELGWSQRAVCRDCRAGRQA